MIKRERESDSEELMDTEFQPASDDDQENEEEFESAEEGTSKPPAKKAATTRNATSKKKSNKAKVTRPEDEARIEEPEAGFENENGEEFFVLSNTRRVTIRKFAGKKCVDLREYYQTKDKQNKPSSKGLLLPVDQFKRLIDLVPRVNAAIERL